jgi:hypothetical protein
MAMHAAQRSNALYMYAFDQPWSFDGWGPHFEYCNGYSCHGVELPYTFGTGARVCRRLRRLGSNGWTENRRDPILLERVPSFLHSAPIVFNWTQEEAALSHSILDYFGNFAWTGNPNVPSALNRSSRAKQLVNWPAFTPESLSYQRLVAPEAIPSTGYQKEACDFFDQFSYDPIRKGPDYLRFNPQPLFGRAQVV